MLKIAKLHTDNREIRHQASKWSDSQCLAFK